MRFNIFPPHQKEDTIQQKLSGFKKKKSTQIHFSFYAFNCVTWSSFCTHNDWAFLAARCKAFFPTGTKQQINRSH